MHVIVFSISFYWKFQVLFLWNLTELWHKDCKSHLKNFDCIKKKLKNYNIPQKTIYIFKNLEKNISFVSSSG